MTVNLNGDFSQWTLGTTFAAAPTGKQLADGWRLHKAGSAVHTIRRSTDVPDIRICGRILPYSMEIEVTTPDATVGASDVTALVYRGEGSELAEMFGRRIRVSGWLKGPVGTYGLHISNGAETLSYAQPFKIDDANRWSYFDVWAPWFGEDADWWTDTRVGYTFALVLMAGGDFRSEFDKWHEHAPSAFTFTGGGSGQINFNDTDGNILKIAGLRIGEGPSMFQPPEFVEQACLRYLEKSFDRGVDPAQGIGNGTGEFIWHALLAGAQVQPSPRQNFIVPKRKAPTMTGFNPASANAQARVNGADCTLTTFEQVNPWGFRVKATTPAGVTVGTPIGLHTLADASLPALGTNIGG